MRERGGQTEREREGEGEKKDMIGECDKQSEKEKIEERGKIK